MPVVFTTHANYRATRIADKAFLRMAVRSRSDSNALNNRAMCGEGRQDSTKVKRRRPAESEEGLKIEDWFHRAFRRKGIPAF
jgi:hypothetical protein